MKNSLSQEAGKTLLCNFTACNYKKRVCVHVCRDKVGSVATQIYRYIIPNMWVWAHCFAYLVGRVGTQKYSSTIIQIYIRWWILGASKYASSHMEYITQLHCRKHSWEMYNTSWNSLHAVWSTRIWSIRNEHWSSIKCYLEAVTSLLLHKDKKNPVLNQFLIFLIDHTAFKKNLH